MIEVVNPFHLFTVAGQPAGLRAEDRVRTRYGMGLVLSQGGTAQSLTGTTVQTALRTFTLPGGLMGPNGSMMVHAIITGSATANAKVLTLNFGGLALANGAALGGSGQSGRVEFWVFNRNAHNQQIAPSPSMPDSSGTWASPLITGPGVDTRQDVPCNLSGTLSSGADTMALEAWRVIVYPDASFWQ